MIFRRRASPLHAARAAAGGLYCFALAVCALSFQHPLVLAAVMVATIGAAIGAGAGHDLATAARFTVPLGILVALVNPFVIHEGLTVFWRFGDVPPFGEIDLTVEALVYGVLLGTRVVAVALCCALFVAAVDPDETLQLFRRVSFRSALTAALAARLMPVLARDARRMADASACRADATAPGRVAVMRAVATSALDRAIDVAATLEVRGYGAHGAARRAHAPWSRHDVAFTASALALIALAVLAHAGGVATFAAYPSLAAPVGPAEVALAVVLVAVAWLPFADRRGIER